MVQNDEVAAAAAAPEATSKVLLLSLHTFWGLSLLLFSKVEEKQLLKKLPPLLPSLLEKLLRQQREKKEKGDDHDIGREDLSRLTLFAPLQLEMFTMSGQRLGLTTYYRTISVDNKPTTVIIGPSK